MGVAVLILGESGSGKSASLRNFKQEDVGILNVASKPLPFRNVNKLQSLNKATYDSIKKAVSPMTSCKKNVVHQDRSSRREWNRSSMNIVSLSWRETRLCTR